jgi:diguanylate cyclase (GGDEF)-like protein
MANSPYIKKISLRRVITTFVIIILVLFFMLFSVLYFIEDNSLSVRRNELENKMIDSVTYQADHLGNEFDSILSDLNFLSQNYGNKILKEGNIDEISAEWSRVSESRKIYDQIRYLDADGNEVIRINFKDNQAVIVPEDQLQNKADRYYFYETLTLDEGHVFISKLDLNIEDGEIEKPIKPVIRYSIAINNDKGEFCGAIVLNVLASRMIDDYKALPKGDEGETYLLNEQGYYISNNDPSKEWGFMYDGMEDINFSVEFNEAWNKIGIGSGLIQTDEGLFAYSNIDIVDKFKINEAYLENDRIVLGDSYLIAISYVASDGEYKELFAESFDAKAGVILDKYRWYFIAGLIIALIIAVYAYINARAKARIEYFSKYDALTNTYNRRAGFDLIDKHLPKNSRRSSNMCIIFIDVNGLKLVNDNLGHKSGDELLVTVADIVKKIIREDELLIRIGGDEFVIVLKDIDLIKCEIVWDRIVQSYQNINMQENRKYEISVSHGAVALDEFKEKDIDDIIKIADERMYEEKREMKKNATILR